MSRLFTICILGVALSVQQVFAETTESVSQNDVGLDKSASFDPRDWRDTHRHQMAMGLVAGIARYQTGTTTGQLVYLNGHSYFLNAGLDIHQVDANYYPAAYLGIGLGSLLQVQTGEGTLGSVSRVRVELTVLKNITVLLIKETFTQRSELDNLGVGVGYIW